MKNLLIVHILISQIVFSQSVSNNLDKSVKEMLPTSNVFIEKCNLLAQILHKNLINNENN